MKVVCLLLMLIVFSQFALESEGQPEIGLIYFLPSNRTAQADIDSNIDTLIKSVQTVYAERMDAAGYGRKTFTLETNDDGTAKVYHITGEHSPMRIMRLPTNGKFGAKFGQKDMNLQKRSTLHLLI